MPDAPREVFEEPHAMAIRAGRRPCRTLGLHLLVRELHPHRRGPAQKVLAASALIT